MASANPRTYVAYAPTGYPEYEDLWHPLKYAGRLEVYASMLIDLGDIKSNLVKQKLVELFTGWNSTLVAEDQKGVTQLLAFVSP